MPELKKILCLANSRKHGERCVAGIDLDSGKWLRPVNHKGVALSDSDISFQNGERPKVFDIIQVPVLTPEPLYYQPENWLIDKDYYWERIGSKKLDFLRSHEEDGPFILRGANDRLSVSDLQQNPIEKSLVLIKSRDITFIKTRSYIGRLQIRADFKYKNNQYNLGVTDLEWEKVFTREGSVYSDYKAYLFKGIFYLVIGLGTAFQECHYKLVVSVIPQSPID